MKKLCVVLTFCLMGCGFAEEPELKCERRIGEIQWQGMTFKRYGLRAEHFPPQKKFQLFVKCDGLETKIFSYVANQKGHLILQPTEEMQKGYAICPVRQGEEISFVMRSEDEKQAAITDVLVFPLQMKSKKGVLLELKVTSARGDQFLLNVKHLHPGECVDLTCQVNQNHVGIPAQVNEKGELEADISLPETGSGSAVLLLKTKKEEILFPFEWGETSLKYVGACCLELK